MAAMSERLDGPMFIVKALGGDGDEVDKFERCEWSPGPDGTPVLDGVPGWFGGRVLDRLDMGDDVGLWLEPVVGEDAGGPLDLGFQAVKDIDPGHGL